MSLILNGPRARLPPPSSAQVALALAREALLLTVRASVANATAPGSVETLTSERIFTTATVVVSITSQLPQITPAAQNSTLEILGTLAGVPGNVTQPSAVLILTAAGAVATAAISGGPASSSAAAAPPPPGQGASAAAASADVLSGVLGVVDSVVAGQSAAVNATSPALQLIAPTIQVSLSLDNATRPSGGDLPGASRLYTRPITADNAPSSFDPLPVGTFDAAAAALASSGSGGSGGGSSPTLLVRTEFVALAFDPYALRSPEGAQARRTGATRLAFTTADGIPVAIQGLASPITFSLPAVDLRSSDAGSSGGSSPERQGQCVFWDAARGAYSAQGCAALPNPLPPRVSASWLPGFSAARDADLARGWTLSEDDGTSTSLLSRCAAEFLDCTSATSVDRTRSVYPDPRRPFAFPAVRCPNGSAGVLRAYAGSGCLLYQANNSARCYWCVFQQSEVAVI